jgi:hypothetical protein
MTGSRARTRRRRLALAAVVGSSAVPALRFARRPREKARPRPGPAPTPEPSGGDLAAAPPKLRRRLVFAAILGTSTLLAVWSAHQEEFGAGFLITLFGFAAIGVVLGLALWWQRAWGLIEDSLLRWFSTLGLALVTELVLTHRGALTEVEVARVRASDDGGGDYTLVVPGGSTPLRGELDTTADFVVGERFTVLASGAATTCIQNGVRQPDAPRTPPRARNAVADSGPGDSARSPCSGELPPVSLLKKREFPGRETESTFRAVCITVVDDG